MPLPVRIAVVGDFNPKFPPHFTTNDSVAHTAAALGIPVEAVWIPTPEVERQGAEAALRGFHGVWISPGSPYRSAEGVFTAIRYARTGGWPLFST